MTADHAPVPHSALRPDPNTTPRWVDNNYINLSSTDKDGVNYHVFLGTVEHVDIWYDTEDDTVALIVDDPTMAGYIWLFRHPETFMFEGLIDMKPIDHEPMAAGLTFPIRCEILALLDRAGVLAHNPTPRGVNPNPNP